MFIVLDDTYSGEIDTKSRFVTKERRTWVAVEFSDQEVSDLRLQIRECLESMQEEHPAIREFHFTSIYNGRDGWETVPGPIRLKIIEFFAHQYSKYRWRVHIQTIDEHTFFDHGIFGFEGTVDGLDLSDRPTICLLKLMCAVKNRLDKSPHTYLVDAGLVKIGTDAFPSLFHDRPGTTSKFANSEDEPLLQIADFLAFMINRTSHVLTKKRMSKGDKDFIEVVSLLNLNSHDVATMKIDPDKHNVDHFDYELWQDRSAKGLKPGIPPASTSPPK